VLRWSHPANAKAVVALFWWDRMVPSLTRPISWTRPWKYFSGGYFHREAKGKTEVGHYFDSYPFIDQRGAKILERNLSVISGVIAPKYSQLHSAPPYNKRMLNCMSPFSKSMKLWITLTDHRTEIRHFSALIVCLTRTGTPSQDFTQAGSFA
jgi:hypothetical protein